MKKGTVRKVVSFDWAIKYILRDKANFEILEGFLTTLLKQKVEILELIESEGNQKKESEKFNRVDILAKISDKEDVLIEVQYAEETYLFKRLLYGTCRDIIDNMKTGSGYENVKKVYSVAILYFDVEDHSHLNKEDLKNKELPEIATDYVIQGQTHFFGFHNKKPINLNKRYLDGINELKENKNVFPEYFIIPTGIFPDKITDDLDEWIYMFKNNKVKEEFTAPGIEKAKESLAYVNMTPEEKKKHDDIEYSKGANKGVIHAATQKGIETGRKEERLIADKELENKDKQLENKDKQLEEEKRKLEEAKINMILELNNNNVSLEIIAIGAQLSELEVTKIINNNK